MIQWARDTAKKLLPDEAIGPQATFHDKPQRPQFELMDIDWENLVVLDFESYYDTDYTLKKLSTSEYIRDPRFKAQMVGVKVGLNPTVVIPHEDISGFLASIDMANRGLLCHNTAFDGFILHHHYGVHPRFYFDTLSMARGLHSNDIGAGLDEVAQHYKLGNKVPNVLDRTKGVVDWDDELYEEVAAYCAQDVELCLAIFKKMVARYPKSEMELIHQTIKMFCMPRLLVDIPRVEAELKRELDDRQQMFDTIYKMKTWDLDELKLTKKERALPEEELKIRIVKKVIGSNERLAKLLADAGVIFPPMKISAAWAKKHLADGFTAFEIQQMGDSVDYIHAFSATDTEFVNLPDTPKRFNHGLDLNAPGTAMRLAIRAAIIRSLVEARLLIKSTTNITRAERFLTAGANGMPLPAGYSYFRAHTGRWGGNNSMNLQNLKRGGELRQSILAPPGHVLCVADSGQIEARVNGWLWGEEELLDSFRKADKWNKKTMGVARGDDRDAYCKFADEIYHREITTEDSLERFVGKVGVLGLGFQMGGPKLQLTLARGALGGPPVHFTANQCYSIVNAYRLKNQNIVIGWEVCNTIIQSMAAGACGSYGPLSWEKNLLWLPNGMYLRYPDLKSTDTARGIQWSYRGKYSRLKIYGGLLCENIVQALARIIIAEQLLEISRSMHVVMMTHDEIVTCVKESNAELAFGLMETAMRRPPAWCPDLPLNCEGGWATNYSK
jgi:DNA polymerase